MTDYGSALLANNPHVKFYNAQRGFVMATVTPTRWTTEFKVLPQVTRPGAAIETRATYVVEAGRPGAQIA
jgi:alkaline phosphatase D